MICPRRLFPCIFNCGLQSSILGSCINSAKLRQGRLMKLCYPGYELGERIIAYIQLAPPYFGGGDRQVNWCGKLSSLFPSLNVSVQTLALSGFYINSVYFPSLRIVRVSEASDSEDISPRLLLGPFCGKPACQFVATVKLAASVQMHSSRASSRSRIVSRTYRVRRGHEE
jgi:hypothetical protein